MRIHHRAGGRIILTFFHAEQRILLRFNLYRTRKHQLHTSATIAKQSTILHFSTNGCQSDRPDSGMQLQACCSARTPLPALSCLLTRPAELDASLDSRCCIVLEHQGRLRRSPPLRAMSDDEMRDHSGASLSGRSEKAAKVPQERLEATMRRSAPRPVALLVNVKARPASDSAPVRQ